MDKKHYPTWLRGEAEGPEGANLLEIADELEALQSKLLSRSSQLEVALREVDIVAGQLKTTEAELDNQTRYAAGALEEMTRQRDEAVSRLGEAEKHGETIYDEWQAAMREIERLQYRLDAAEKDNAFSRKWIRELRDKIDDLMRGDPPADSADGIRLIALADVCEAYEKGVVEIGEQEVRGFQRGKIVPPPWPKESE